MVMSRFNFRVIKQFYPKSKETVYSIHTVFYDELNRLNSWTKEPTTPISCEDTEEMSLDELRWELEQYQKAFDKPVLDWDELEGLVGKVV